LTTFTTPGQILAFATGSSKVPAIGFHPTPKLIFIHDGKKKNIFPLRTLVQMSFTFL